MVENMLEFIKISIYRFNSSLKSSKFDLFLSAVAFLIRSDSLSFGLI
jgi:hypothetical protein